MSLTFGTDGIRNGVGKPPLTQNNLLKLGKAIAIWALQKREDLKSDIPQLAQDISIIICHDTRESSYWIKSVLKSSLLRYPVNVFDAQILPTPAIFQLMKDNNQFNIGIVITASHNKFRDNGIKLITSSKPDSTNYKARSLPAKITKEDEAQITKLFNNKISNINYKGFGREIYLKDAQEQYIQKIVSLFKPNAERISFLKNQKIILDVANGATYEVAAEIFKRLGANLITINNKPDGKNINHNCGATHTESLQRAVIKYKADIGFAFDGDGDRVIAVNSEGQIKDGDDFLAILSEHPEYNLEKTIVATVMSNYGLENFLESKSKSVVYTNVGDKFVIEKLQEKNLNLGGEQSGHIILRNIINTSDGIIVALKLLETHTLTKNSHCEPAFLNKVWTNAKLDTKWKLETFEKYPQVQINLPVKLKKDLKNAPFKNIIADAEKKLIHGRILVRYSGTENYLRILVEDKNLNNAQSIIQELTKNFQLVL